VALTFCSDYKELKSVSLFSANYWRKWRKLSRSQLVADYWRRFTGLEGIGCGSQKLSSNDFENNRFSV